MKHKVYCVECGSEMVEKNTFIANYNLETGKPEYLVRYHCPKARWWNFSLFGHPDLIFKREVNNE